MVQHRHMPRGRVCGVHVAVLRRRHLALHLAPPPCTARLASRAVRRTRCSRMDLQLHASRARRAQARAAAGVGARHTNHGATWRAANAAHRSTLCGGIESVSWPLGCRASLCRRAGTSASPGHRAAGLTSTTCSPACTAAALTVGHAAPPCVWHGRSGKHYHSISCAFALQRTRRR